ncbi:hypothetical protein HDU85_002176, partial [Gaertneriomyces sp. JEL0708]
HLSPVDDLIKFIDADSFINKDAHHIVTNQMSRLHDLIVNSLHNAKIDDDSDVVVEHVSVCAGSNTFDENQAIAQSLHEAAVAEAIEEANKSPDASTTTVVTYSYTAPIDDHYRILLFGCLVCWAIAGLVAIVWIVVDALKHDDNEVESISIPAPVMKTEQVSQYQLREPLLHDTTGIMV